MKKVIVAIISLSFLLTLSGCKMFSYWGGMTRNQCEKYVTEQLKEKYNEEFTVVKFFKSGNGKLEGVCVPKRDERLPFEVELNPHTVVDGYEFRDAYIQGIVRKEMLDEINNVLSKHFKNYAVDLEVRGLLPCYDSGITDASKASIEAYTEAVPEENTVFLWMAFDENEVEKNREKIEPILDECSVNFHKSNIVWDCHFVNEETMQECKRSIAENNTEFIWDIGTSLSVLLNQNKPVYHYYYSQKNGNPGITLVDIKE